MSKDAKQWFLAGLAGLVLVLFAAIWIWIGFKMLGFSGTKDTPELTFSDAQVTVAGFLASAVGAGTASVLGFEIKNVQRQGGDQGVASLGTQLSTAVAQSWMLIIGIGVYAVVGVFVLLVWFFNSTTAPEMVNAFSLGVLGWLAGAFAAVFKAE
jgi:hypothetical protein